MEGKDFFFKLCIKKKGESESSLPGVSDARLTRCYITHCYLIGSDAKVCLFQLPLILYIICCYLFNFHFLFLSMFCFILVCVYYLMKHFILQFLSTVISAYLCTLYRERSLISRNTTFIRGAWHFHLFFPHYWWKAQTTINLAILPLLNRTGVDVLCFFLTWEKHQFRCPWWN